MPVPMEDVVRLLGGLKPGSTHTAKALYRQYAQNMERDEREPQHPVSLGVTLKKYGCERVRLRKRVKGVQIESTGWTLPGKAPGPDGLVNPVTEMIRSFGTDGIYTEDEVYTRYIQFCGRHHHTPVPRQRLMYELTQAGHPRLTHKRRVCRWLNVPAS